MVLTFEINALQDQLFQFYIHIPPSINVEMCTHFEYLLAEMQYDIHNYIFSGV